MNTVTPTEPRIFDIDTVASLALEDIEGIGPVARTFALQNAADSAQRHFEWVRERLADEIDREERIAASRGAMGSLTPAHERIANDPDVKAAKAAADEARGIATEAQEGIGGIAFCVANDKLAYAHKTIEALSRKAVKIDCDTITLTDTDERVLLHYTYAEDEERAYHATFEHTFVILKGTTPRIPGFEFLATITTTEAGNLVKTVPAWGWAVRHNMADAKAGAEALEAIDLSRFYHTGDICEHCGTHRDRTDTFVVYNEETGDLKQVGRTCLKDFTGTNNPERIVKVLQQVWDAMRSLSSKGDTPPILTTDFLAHAAAIYRVAGGYRKGEHKYDTLNNLYAQRNQSKDKTGAPMWVEPTEDDIAFAQAVRRWALTDWEGFGDFPHNVKTAITPEVMTERMAGYAAAVFAAWQRQQGVEAEKKAEEKTSEFIGEMGKRGEFTLTVTDIRWREGYYGGDAPTYTFEDADGNRARWRASDSNGMVVGGTYRVKASVKKDGDYPGHEDHAKYGKTTHLQRLSIEDTISEPEED
jgi:hypothetical protein